MSKKKTVIPYTITHEERLALLEAHNDLKNILQTIFDCQDLWMSDIKKLEHMQADLHRIFKFVPKQDDAGHRLHYADWILDEDDTSEDD